MDLFEKISDMIEPSSSLRAEIDHCSENASELVKLLGQPVIEIDNSLRQPVNEIENLLGQPIAMEEL